MRTRHINGQRLKASWTTYYRLGVEASKGLQPVATLEQVGSRFGLTKQNAYTACVVALGKLCFRMRRELEERR